MQANKKYFGTDGIRGRVGGATVNPAFMLQLGWAAGQVLASTDCSTVVIGKDTRISGYMLESALEAGFSAAGVDVLLSGPAPTPAVAYLTRTLHACMGIVVTASHNSYEDNGIKLFDSGGHKLSDDIELAIESSIDQAMQVLPSAQLGKAQRIDNADVRYIEFCKASVPAGLSLRGMKLVVDCANGASYHIAPRVFSELGAEVIGIGVAPDGLNINRDCGALKLSALQAAVTENKADLGVALDGDADRIMMVDHLGRTVDGDQILFIIACARARSGCMRGAVVGTLASNLGLERAIEAAGLQFIREQVGDRHVVQRLRQDDGIIGGETSGHIICLDKSTTGDGIVAALQVIHVINEEGKSLADLCQGMKKYPQTTINIPVAAILPQQHLGAADAWVDKARRQLNGEGRVLLRPSGTEPLVRVTVEGEDEKQINRIARRLADQVAGLLE